MLTPTYVCTDTYITDQFISSETSHSISFIFLFSKQWPEWSSKRSSVHVTSLPLRKFTSSWDIPFPLRLRNEIKAPGHSIQGSLFYSFTDPLNTNRDELSFGLWTHQTIPPPQGPHACYPPPAMQPLRALGKASSSSFFRIQPKRHFLREAFPQTSIQNESHPHLLCSLPSENSLQSYFFCTLLQLSVCCEVFVWFTVAHPTFRTGPIQKKSVYYLSSNNYYLRAVYLSVKGQAKCTPRARVVTGGDF